MKRNTPYIGGNGHFDSVFVPRDSRQVLNGHRFQVERPSRDWMFAVAGFAAAFLFIVVMAGQL